MGTQAKRSIKKKKKKKQKKKLKQVVQRDATVRRAEELLIKSWTDNPNQANITDHALQIGMLRSQNSGVAASEAPNTQYQVRGSTRLAPLRGSSPSTGHGNHIPAAAVGGRRIGSISPREQLL